MSHPENKKGGVAVGEPMAGTGGARKGRRAVAGVRPEIPLEAMTKDFASKLYALRSLRVIRISDPPNLTQKTRRVGDANTRSAAVLPLCFQNGGLVGYRIGAKLREIIVMRMGDASPEKAGLRRSSNF
jgi:hypothetical protein